MTDSISQAPDEREAIVRWLLDAAKRKYDDHAKKCRWADDDILDAILAQAGAFEAAADAIDHLSEQGEGYE